MRANKCLKRLLAKIYIVCLDSIAFAFSQVAKSTPSAGRAIGKCASHARATTRPKAVGPNADMTTIVGTVAGHSFETALAPATASIFAGLADIPFGWQNEMS